MNLNNPKKFSIVGGKENADFIFQSAIDDKSENKNWKLIVANLNSVTINNAKKWFMSIIKNRRYHERFDKRLYCQTECIKKQPRMLF